MRTVQQRIRTSGVATGIAVLAGTAALAPNAYVADSSDDTVSVVDTSTNTVVTTIPVGDSPWGVEVAPAAGIFTDGFESGDTSAW
jgi:YVTN family beta-propeller protein